MNLEMISHPSSIFARLRMRLPIVIAATALACFVGWSEAVADPQTTNQFKRDKAPLEGPHASSNAQGLITGLSFPCRTVTKIAFVKQKGDIKIFKAQCDGRKWYVLLQSAEGQMKAFEWSGAGEPH